MAGDPRAGQLFVQGRVERGGSVGLFDEIVGRGWTLLCRSADPGALLDPEAAAFFAALGGIGAWVGADGPVRDLDGVYERWFADAGVAVVLQRPDFYVFGTAPRADDAGVLVAQLRRLLAAGPPRPPVARAPSTDPAGQPGGRRRGRGRRGYDAYGFSTRSM
jgi:hypothetical protein